MKKSLLFAVAFTSAILMSCDLNANNQAVTNKAALETPKGKHSYAIGMDMGRGLKHLDAELDHAILLQGIKDQLDTTRESLMNDSQFREALQDLMAEMRKKQMAKDSIRMEEQKQLAAENLVKQNAFLEKNKSELGVIATESGLQYITMKEGKGKEAKDGDTVVVHYTGMLMDGNKFDSSLDRNQPLSITLGEGQLIKGWVEMLRLMKAEQKVKLWIPSSLGYGENGNQVIPGNSLLVFEMELLEIKPAKK